MTSERREEKSLSRVLEEYALNSNESHVLSKGGSPQDAADLHRIGKFQELHRIFSFVPIFGFVTGLMCTWEAVQATSSFGLTDGGRAGLVWEYLFVVVGFGFATLSMAEMASMAPTTGGQYHWVSEFAPQSAQKLLSYVTGWLCVLGWQMANTSAMFIGGQLIQGLIALNNEDYVSKRWHLTLIVIAISMFSCIFNTVLAKQLPLVEMCILTIHFGAFIAFLVIFWVCSKGKRSSAADVFGSFENFGGWSSQGLSVLVGSTGALFSLMGPDAAVHMAEEVKDASRVIPLAMSWGMLANGFMGLIMTVTFCFCITSVERVLDTPTGFPMVQVFYDITGSVGSTSAMASIIMLLFMAGTIAVTASGSRQLYAFARDQGLPFSKFFCYVHSKSELPLNAIFTTFIITVLLSLINIGSYVAFNAFVSLGVSALSTSYIISISCLIIKRFRRECFPPKRWSLGRWGLLVNLLGVGYLLLGFVVSFFPLSTPVDSKSMNWSIVMYGGFNIIGLTYYFFCARHIYTGPVVQVRTL